MCLWGRSEKNYTAEIRCAFWVGVKNSSSDHENYILQTKRSAEYRYPVVGIQSLTREYQSF